MFGIAVLSVVRTLLLARNAQEAGDLCLISRRAAEACSTPFFNVQDGFLTTHTIEAVIQTAPLSGFAPALNALGGLSEALGGP